jgi:hypothetical protein
MYIVLMDDIACCLRDAWPSPGNQSAAAPAATSAAQTGCFPDRRNKQPRRWLSGWTLAPQLDSYPPTPRYPDFGAFRPSAFVIRRTIKHVPLHQVHETITSVPPRSSLRPPHSHDSRDPGVVFCPCRPWIAHNPKVGYPASPEHPANPRNNGADPANRHPSPS